MFLTALVLKMRRERKFPGEHILVQGERGKKFFVLTQGEAVLVKDGVEMVRLQPGACFGEFALFTDSIRRDFTVRATVPCELLTLKREDFNELVDHYPAYKDKVRGEKEGKES